MGTVVYDANGGAHTVDREDVAAHPGDNGMQAIADLIITAYSDMNNEQIVLRGTGFLPVPLSTII